MHTHRTIYNPTSPNPSNTPPNTNSPHSQKHTNNPPTPNTQGGDVRNALSNDPDGRLAWAHEGKRLALDIVSGLSFLHANKLIHRDLKSKNVLLTDKGVAKICDVGLAKIHDNGYATQDSMFGTFAWAAPELLLGQKYVV